MKFIDFKEGQYYNAYDQVTDNNISWRYFIYRIGDIKTNNGIFNFNKYFYRKSIKTTKIEEFRKLKINENSNL